MTNIRKLWRAVFDRIYSHNYDRSDYNRSEYVEYQNFSFPKLIMRPVCMIDPNELILGAVVSIIFKSFTLFIKEAIKSHPDLCQVTSYKNHYI